MNEGFRELESLSQSILAKAFRGELVPQDPNDEPASVLLERIRADGRSWIQRKRQKVKLKRKPQGKT
jgi:type I restriction enzyme S subunit